jgi:8-oxo-dGTP diphosphatase
MNFQKLDPDTIRLHKGKSFPGVTTTFFCHDGNGKLFLAQRSNRARDEHGRWDPGGGGLKFGQSLIENLNREIKEEYNATSKQTDFLGYFDVFRTDQEGVDTHWLAMCFAVHRSTH